MSIIGKSVGRLWRCQRFCALALAVSISLADYSTQAKESKTEQHGSAVHVVPHFAQLPPGWELDAVAGVATDSQNNVIIFHRGPHPLIIFDKKGKYLRSFGDGMFQSAHGLRVDATDNIWVTDNANHTVIKFSHAGKILMTLGEKDVAGEDDYHFNRPADIAFAPNGDFFVADGYGNSRIVKFDKNGKYLLEWGKKGAAEGEFNVPHAIRLDSRGNVYVADRENKRIQVFDSNGIFLRQMSGFAPFGLFITEDDTVYVVDGLANNALQMTLEGKILNTWGSSGSEPGQFNVPHAVTVGKDNEVYVTEIKGKRVQKFVK